MVTPEDFHRQAIENFRSLRADRLARIQAWLGQPDVTPSVERVVQKALTDIVKLELEAIVPRQVVALALDIQDEDMKPHIVVNLDLQTLAEYVLGLGSTPPEVKQSLTVEDMAMAMAIVCKGAGWAGFINGNLLLQAVIVLQASEQDAPEREQDASEREQDVPEREQEVVP